jgi:F-type H+-transporting ATPase subunit b
MRLSSRRLRAATLLLATALPGGALFTASAQTPTPAAGQSQDQAQGQVKGGDNGTFLDKNTAQSQNLAKAEQEDEEYTFKHSASVRAFARMFHLSPETASVVFWALNALLLFGLVGYFLLKALPKAFRSRRELLQRQLEEARKATEEANERLRVVEERLSRLDSEIAAVRAQAEQDSANDEARVKQSLEEERRKIVSSAEQEIASAGATAERQLRKFAAGLALDRATTRLHLTEGDDRALIQEFASSLGSTPGAGDSRGGRN